MSSNPMDYSQPSSQIYFSAMTPGASFTGREWTHQSPQSANYNLFPAGQELFTQAPSVRPLPLAVGHGGPFGINSAPVSPVPRGSHLPRSFLDDTQLYSASTEGNSPASTSGIAEYPIDSDAMMATDGRPFFNQPAPRPRKTRREKPHIPLAADQPPTTQGKQRARVFVACLQCRNRKIRCDGAKPVCHNCARRTGNESCDFEELPRRRGPDKTPGARQRTVRELRHQFDAEVAPIRRRRRRDTPAPQHDDISANASFSSVGTSQNVDPIIQSVTSISTETEFSKNFGSPAVLISPAARLPVARLQTSSVLASSITDTGYFNGPVTNLTDFPMHSLYPPNGLHSR